MFLALFAAATAPVWIISAPGDGLMISWNAPTSKPLHLTVQTGARARSYPLERPSGMIIVPMPSQPYRISYQLQGDAAVTLQAAGALPFPSKPVVPEPATTGALRLAANMTAVDLRLPRPPRQVRTTLRGSRPVTVDMFIKINPSGKVTATSSPYYSDRIRRELSRLASDTATKQWRFQRVRTPHYRDGRIQLMFYRDRTTIRPYRS
ncbi:MAG TPA: hypothetical protein VER03_21210 [Bryobacteraceae bacterium]|nr:hypothetical protein [Bryobacteraceae bacterium]